MVHTREGSTAFLPARSWLAAPAAATAVNAVTVVVVAVVCGDTLSMMRGLGDQMDRTLQTVGSSRFGGWVPASTLTA